MDRPGDDAVARVRRPGDLRNVAIQRDGVLEDAQAGARRPLFRDGDRGFLRGRRRREPLALEVRHLGRQPQVLGAVAARAAARVLGARAQVLEALGGVLGGRRGRGLVLGRRRRFDSRCLALRFRRVVELALGAPRVLAGFGQEPPHGLAARAEFGVLFREFVVDRGHCCSNC